MDGHESSLGHFLGIAYVSCWAVCLYPQAILNWRNGSTDGLSSDFVVLNLLGYSAYSVFNWRLYQEDTGGVLAHVKLFDLVFALHGTLLCLIIACQALVLYREPSARSKPLLTRNTRIVLGLLCAVIAASLYADLMLASVGEGAFHYTISSLGFVKAAASLYKYLPQMLKNYQARSVAGISLVYMCLDLTGSILCIGQIILLDTWTDNVPKVVLAVCCCMFESVFLFQFFSYRNGKKIVIVG